MNLVKSSTRPLGGGGWFLMFMWFHWCSCGFIDFPVVFIDAPVVSLMFLCFYDVHVVSLMFMFMWFHLCSCVFSVFMGHQFQFSMICECIYEIHVSLHGTRLYWCVHLIKGAPSQEFLEQPITASDHPFLRANVTSIKAHKMQQRALKGRFVSKNIKVQRKYDLNAPHDVEKFWSIYNIDEFV